MQALAARVVKRSDREVIRGSSRKITRRIGRRCSHRNRRPVGAWSRSHVDVISCEIRLGVCRPCERGRSIGGRRGHCQRDGNHLRSVRGSRGRDSYRCPIRASDKAGDTDARADSVDFRRGRTARHVQTKPSGRFREGPDQCTAGRVADSECLS